MDLSVLTYNIHKAIGNDRKYNLGRIIDICRDMNPDFIALQEVDHFAPRSKNENLAHIISQELGMDYALGLNVKLKKGAYGNATLSRFPIERSINLNITWAIKKPRGCLISLIPITGSNLTILNFHLGLAGMERLRQIRKITHNYRTDQMNLGPAIALGDTNDRIHRMNRLLLDEGMADTLAMKKENTFPAYAPLFRLDKIYFNDFLKLKETFVMRSKSTRMASDHLPVFARFTLIK